MDVNVKITNDTYKIVIDRLRQNTKNSQETMVTTGQFIIGELYNGNYEEAVKKKYSKNSSISELIKLINEDKTGNLPITVNRLQFC